MLTYVKPSRADNPLPSQETAIFARFKQHMGENRQPLVIFRPLSSEPQEKAIASDKTIAPQPAPKAIARQLLPPLALACP
ncbi:hypothetical protein [Phormidium sp. CCY1219]|uniref:hypothetical protein n=1 Tax=Phormidium sp. CCY1219 TaxID=2886104 RepID=UPI002D1F0D87|nr:hypothetical protein [Phormidium sp. CCY1219]MEB3826741.1 hypothetical protein [Phormidium sp. CCY1219]